MFTIFHVHWRLFSNIHKLSFTFTNCYLKKIAKNLWWLKIRKQFLYFFNINLFISNFINNNIKTINPDCEKLWQLCVISMVFNLFSPIWHSFLTLFKKNKYFYGDFGNVLDKGITVEVLVSKFAQMWPTIYSIYFLSLGLHINFLFRKITTFLLIF